MSFTKTLLEGPIPKPLFWTLVPISAVVLVSLFVFLGFPYDALGARFAQLVGDMTGSQVQIRGVSPRITVGGPGFRAKWVQVITPDQTTYEAGPVGVRPAWSTSWFSLEPALHVDLESPVGNAAGMLVIGSGFGFDGEVSEVDLGLIPIPDDAAVSISGALDGEVDVFVRDGAPEGQLKFSAASGSISHDALPLAIDFETAGGDLILGGDNFVEVVELSLDGPVVSANAEGTVGASARFGSAPLDMGVDLQIKNPGLVMMVQGFGLQLDSDGRASFDVSGTPTNPRTR
jgi:type II secretion system protein N